MRVRIYVAGFVFAALVFISTANAMQIPQYEKMSPQDQGHYVTLLVKGAVEGLRAHNQSEQAEKLLSLFEDPSEKGGIRQFDKNLQAARILNSKNTAGPKFTPYEVENAMAVTLKDNGITVPVSFLLGINKDFKPAYPPSSDAVTPSHLSASHTKPN